MDAFYFVFPPETTNISSPLLRADLFSLFIEDRSFAKPRSALRQISIQQHGDAVACETAGVASLARAHGPLPILPALDFVQKFVGKLVEFRYFKSHYVQHRIACISAIHAASFARVLRYVHGDQIRSFQQRNHFFFLLSKAQVRHLPGKVLHGEESVCPSRNGNAYGRELGVENIPSVPRRMHPPVMNFCRIGTDGDVFSHHGIFCASLGSTLVQGRFARQLMREDIFTRHELRVMAGGGGEGIIPFKRVQSGGGTFAVRGIEKDFFLR
jgi:hypothetical protein